MKLYVIGIGPGDEKHMTAHACEALAESQVVAGYPVYLDLIGEHICGKELISTPMKEEVKRCKMALEAAASGKVTAMVCSGDPGVYGMAGLIYELSPGYEGVEIHVIPGITAASSGGAVLGAPLMHDFAVISLSDLLTPWELIEKRLAAAAACDFVICLYNPSSKKRKDYLKKACDIVLGHRALSTVCGIARNIGRPGESGTVLTLSALRETEMDMFATVFIGSSTTRNIGGKMVTPRGYRYE